MNILVNILLWTTAAISLYFAVFWFLVFVDGGARIEKKKKLGALPGITVTIPAWNEVRRERTGEVRCVLAESIDNVMRLQYPKDKVQLIVVNDGSTDGTREVILKTIKKYSKRDIIFIDKKKNQGKWAAMNDALQKATGEYFVTLDADSILPPKVLKKLLRYFTADDIACVCPNMKVKSPKTFIEKMQWYEYIINMFYKKLMGRLDCVHVAPGPFSVYRTDIIKKVGGFRKAYQTEDLELTLRLQDNNYRILQVLDVTVETKCPPSLKAFYAQRNRWFKGATLNAIDYKHMIFNPKYGDFGLMQMPFIIIPAFLALVMISTFAYYTIQPTLSALKTFALVNFDLLPFLRDLSFNWVLVDFDYFTGLMAIFVLLLSVIIFKKAHTHSREKILKQGIFPLAVYFVFYYLLLGVAWAGTIFDIVTKRKMKW